MWKDIKGFEGLYKISDSGDVLSLRRNIILKPKIDRYGYYAVCLFNGKNNHKTIHRLVADAFIEKKYGCNVVNHIDCNKLNNCVDNLEWTTISGNTKHCFEHNKEFKKQVLDNCEKGTEKRKLKLTIKGMTFNSKIEASRYFNVCEKTIYNWMHC